MSLVFPSLKYYKKKITFKNNKIFFCLKTERKTQNDTYLTHNKTKYLIYRKKLLIEGCLDVTK